MRHKAIQSLDLALRPLVKKKGVNHRENPLKMLCDGVDTQGINKLFLRREIIPLILFFPLAFTTLPLFLLFPFCFLKMGWWEQEKQNIRGSYNNWRAQLQHGRDTM